MREEVHHFIPKRIVLWMNFKRYPASAFYSSSGNRSSIAGVSGFEPGTSQFPIAHITTGPQELAMIWQNPTVIQGNISAGKVSEVGQPTSSNFPGQICCPHWQHSQLWKLMLRDTDTLCLSSHWPLRCSSSIPRVVRINNYVMSGTLSSMNSVLMKAGNTNTCSLGMEMPQ